MPGRDWDGRGVVGNGGGDGYCGGWRGYLIACGAFADGEGHIDSFRDCRFLGEGRWDGECWDDFGGGAAY